VPPLYQVPREMHCIPYIGRDLAQLLPLGYTIYIWHHCKRRAGVAPWRSWKHRSASLGRLRFTRALLVWTEQNVTTSWHGYIPTQGSDCFIKAVGMWNQDLMSFVVFFSATTNEGKWGTVGWNAARNTVTSSDVSSLIPCLFSGV
jgi:hypothetical protein